MTLVTRALNAFTNWALKQIPPETAEDVAENGIANKDRKPLIWAYTIKDYIDGSPYLTRVLFPRVFGFRPMLHHFHRPDGDRALHNHPWQWAFSVILAGGYTEERHLDAESAIHGEARTEMREVSRFNVLSRADYHRVVELHGDTWTLFVTGPRAKGWGFLEMLRDGSERFTPWRKYIDRKIAELADRE